jgi:hypothetical protein
MFAVELNQRAKIPSLFLDEDGWLWWSIGNKVFRSIVDHFFSLSALVQGIYPTKQLEHTVKWVLLTHFSQAMLRFNPPLWDGSIYVFCMTAIAEYLFVGTNVGVFRVHRITLETRFMYSIQGLQAVGVDNIPGTGEVIAGTQSVVFNLSNFRTADSDYIIVCTLQGSTPRQPRLSLDIPAASGAVTAIRLYDNAPIVLEYPDLYEDGAWSATGVFY